VEREDRMTTAKAIEKMMKAWETIVAALKRSFLCATEEEVFQMAKRAMYMWLQLFMDDGQEA
jgi:predicted RNase H-like HicB family nuclease